MAIGDQTLGPDSIGSTQELSNILNLLQTTAGVIPIESNFIVKFNIPQKAILSCIDESEPYKWADNLNLKGSIQTLTENGFYFATEITDAGENLGVSKVGPSTDSKVYGNLLSAPVITGRANLKELTVGFIETNASIADFIIRPWLIAVSTYGLFARPANSPQNVKTDFEVIHIDSFARNNNLPRKKVIYKNCVPLSVGNSAYKYAESVNTRIVSTTWAYESYQVISGGDSDIPKK